MSLSLLPGMEVHDHPLNQIETREPPSISGSSRPRSLGEDQLSDSCHTFIETSPPPPLVLTKDTKPIQWSLLVPIFVIFALSTGIAIFILSWVTFIQGIPTTFGNSIASSVKQTGLFLVDEGAMTGQDGRQMARLRVLMFSSIGTQVVCITAPLLVLMAAYITVREWLVIQGQSNDGKDLPTPAQFGLLIKMSSTSSWVAIYETARYLLVKKHHEPAPKLFYASFRTVIQIFSISVLLSAANLWLHISSSAIPWTIPLPSLNTIQSSSNSFLFGIKFNDTLCGSSQPFNSTCSQSYPSIPSIIEAGTLIAENASVVGQIPEDLPDPRFTPSIITLHEEDDLAIITPTLNSSADLWAWTASTYGVRASCNILTDQCHTSQSPNGTSRFWNCSSAGYPDFLPVLDGISLNGTILGLNGTYTLSQINPDLPSHQAKFTVTTNPYTLPILMGPMYGFGEEPLVNFQFQGLVVCQIETFEGYIQHDFGGRYSGTITPSDVVMTNIISAPFFLGTAADLLPSHLDPLLNQFDAADDDAKIAAVNQEVARLVLAGFAGATIPDIGGISSMSKRMVLSQYPAGPFLIYVILLLLYSTQALLIMFKLAGTESPLVRTRDGKEMSSLNLAHNVLTNPLTLVGLALPHTLNGVDEGSLLKEPIDMFGEVSETTGDVGNGESGTVRRRALRLMMDVVDDGPKAGMVFGVREWKRDR